MRFCRLPLRFVASTLSVTLFLTQVLWAHRAQVNVWNERRTLLRAPAIFDPRFSNNAVKNNRYFEDVLPYGSIRKIIAPQSSSTRAQTIIHIQDIHLDSEAQANIGKAIQKLLRQQSVGLVALEGAFRPLDFSVYRKFPYPRSAKAVADYLFKTNRISGPVRTAFTTPTETPFIGVDDEAHYNANVNAYKQAAPLVEPTKQMLQREERALNEKKQSAFNAALLDFDATVTSYRQGQLPWGTYIEKLASLSDASTPDVELLLQALSLEEKLDSARVESERARLLTTLLSKLTPQQSSHFLSRSFSYRMGLINHKDFYDDVRDLCAKTGVSLRRYPAMDDYIRYVLMTDGINAEQILKDAARLEMATYEKLAQTSAEKELIAESRELHLAKKLVGFSLTREEWTEYKSVSSLEFETCNLEFFKNFYREAEIRDRKIAENLLAKTQDSRLQALNAKLIVLVTGGFHASGIDQRLVDAGYKIVTFVPKITKITDENNSGYLSVFTQQKTPLDKLFAGEKLFLPPLVEPKDPLMNETLLLASTAGIAGEAAAARAFKDGFTPHIPKRTAIDAEHGDGLIETKTRYPNGTQISTKVTAQGDIVGDPTVKIKMQDVSASPKPAKFRFFRRYKDVAALLLIGVGVALIASFPMDSSSAFFETGFYAAAAIPIVGRPEDDSGKKLKLFRKTWNKYESEKIQDELNIVLAEDSKSPPVFDGTDLIIGMNWINVYLADEDNTKAAEQKPAVAAKIKAALAQAEQDVEWESITAIKSQVGPLKKKAPAAREKATRSKVNPLLPWLWAGAGLLLLSVGGGLTFLLWPRAKQVQAPQPAPMKEKEPEKPEMPVEKATKNSLTAVRLKTGVMVLKYEEEGKEPEYWSKVPAMAYQPMINPAFKIDDLNRTGDYPGVYRHALPKDVKELREDLKELGFSDRDTRDLVALHQRVAPVPPSDAGKEFKLRNVKLLTTYNLHVTRNQELLDKLFTYLNKKYGLVIAVGMYDPNTTQAVSFAKRWSNRPWFGPILALNEVNRRPGKADVYRRFKTTAAQLKKAAPNKPIFIVLAADYREDDLKAIESMGNSIDGIGINYYETNAVAGLQGLHRRFPDKLLAVPEFGSQIDPRTGRRSPAAAKTFADFLGLLFPSKPGEIGLPVFAAAFEATPDDKPVNDRGWEILGTAEAVFYGAFAGNWRPLTHNEIKNQLATAEDKKDKGNFGEEPIPLKKGQQVRITYKAKGAVDIGVQLTKDSLPHQTPLQKKLQQDAPKRYEHRGNGIIRIEIGPEGVSAKWTYSKLNQEVDQAVAKALECLTAYWQRRNQLDNTYLSYRFPSKDSRRFEVRLFIDDNNRVYMSNEGGNRLYMDDDALHLHPTLLAMIINHEMMPTEFSALQEDLKFYGWLWNYDERHPPILFANRPDLLQPYIQFLADTWLVHPANQWINIAMFIIKHRIEQIRKIANDLTRRELAWALVDTLNSIQPDMWGVDHLNDLLHVPAKDTKTQTSLNKILFRVESVFRQLFSNDEQRIAVQTHLNVMAGFGPQGGHSSPLGKSPAASPVVARPPHITQQIIALLSDDKLVSVRDALRPQAGENRYTALGRMVCDVIDEYGFDSQNLTTEQWAYIFWVLRAKLKGREPSAAQYTGHVVLTLDPEQKETWESDALAMLASNPVDNVVLLGTEADALELKTRLGGKVSADAYRRVQLVIVAAQNTQDGQPILDVVVPALYANNIRGATIVFKNGYIAGDWERLLALYPDAVYNMLPLAAYLEGLLGAVTSLNSAEETQRDFHNFIFA